MSNGGKYYTIPISNNVTYTIPESSSDLNIEKIFAEIDKENNNLNYENYNNPFDYINSNTNPNYGVENYDKYLDQNNYNSPNIINDNNIYNKTNNIRVEGIKNFNNRTMPTTHFRPKFVQYSDSNNDQIFINNGNLTNHPNNIINHNINDTTDINSLINAKTSPDTANKIYVTNYQNNQPKLANVVKIEEAAKNIPKPTPVKKRTLNKSDFQNIVYKDIGIINLGNTCFINSCLQVLIHCPSFIFGIYSKIFSKDKLISKETTPITYYLYSICVHMMNTVNTQEKYIDISNFRYKFVEKHQTFGGFIQNDSQEFCRVLLEDLSNELNDVKTKAVYRTLTNSDKKQKIEKDEEFDKSFRERENSIIIDLFYAQLITSFICQCREETYSFQKILDFPLLLPENTQSIDIMNLLRNNFKPEIIDFESKCKKCQKVSKHQKVTKISRPPNILILSLQRVDEKTQNKNECVVTFPYILDLKEFIDPACGHSNENKYNLYAVINHQGSMDCGHYYSYIRFHGQKHWYLFNDSSVKKVEGVIPSFPYAYALFYIKQKNA